MSLASITAALSDRYTIERELGAGGMATVYLAHDIKHDRQVAIKVLRPELAAVIGAERFLAEIRTTANLQHPHILPLFDSGAARRHHPDPEHHEGEGSLTVLFYVMPYVEGISLRDRLTHEKQLPIADAVRIATEVASALDYAHRHGVIHRDIKPENILLHDGSALVADFGIALAASKAGTRMTETGMSLGTPQYMSPEQAMGERELDARSDVYALGCVTFEMLTGEPPFTGPTAQAIVAKVMTAEPPEMTTLRRTIPPDVADAVHTALQKLPADRFASAAEFSGALNGKSDRRPAARGGTIHAKVPRRPGAVPLVIGTFAVVLAAVAGWLARGRRATDSTAQPVEFAFRFGGGGTGTPVLAISPDGQRIMQEVDDSTGTSHLLMRMLGSTAITTIPGTDGATVPEFSHDGKWISFVRYGEVYKMPASGGPATELADSADFGTAAWTLDDGELIYTKSNAGLWQVPAAGGTAEELTALDTARKEFGHWYPQVLPGGRAAIFTSYATPLARAQIEAVNLSNHHLTVLVQGAVFGRYVAPGYLLYARDGAVFAVAFDAAHLKVTGAAVPVIDDVVWEPPSGLAAYAVSNNGTLVYLKASEWSVDHRVVWSDRTGNEQSAIPDSGSWAEPRLSHDDRWIALTQTEPKDDIWLFDRTRNVLTQLTRAPAAAFGALWMPDSRSIIYTFEDPVFDLHRIPIDASAPDTQIIATPFDKRAGSIGPDGRTLAFEETASHDRIMLMALPGGTPKALDNSGATQRNPAFSPDGRWIAYDEANRNERPQVFVRALDGHAGRVQVSPDGGNQPRWTKGGREIVYRKGDVMVAVSFEPATGTVGAPAVLFRKPDAGQVDGRGQGFDVTPDGSRFLLVLPIENPAAQPAHVILNWVTQLEQKVPR